jgi:hypothetical protein
MKKSKFIEEQILFALKLGNAGQRWQEVIDTVMGNVG